MKIFALGIVFLIAAVILLFNHGDGPFTAEEAGTLLFIFGFAVFAFFASGVDYGEEKAIGKFSSLKDGELYEVIAESEFLGGTCYAILQTRQEGGFIAVSISLSDEWMDKCYNGRLPPIFEAKQAGEFTWECIPRSSSFALGEGGVALN